MNRGLPVGAVRERPAPKERTQRRGAREQRCNDTLRASAAKRKRSLLPGKLQVIGELLVSSIYGLAEDALDKEMAKTYGPLTCALFMFLLLSNWLGIIPHLEEPTKDLNTTLGFGVMGFFIAHYAGIKAKGFKQYAK